MLMLWVTVDGAAMRAVFSVLVFTSLTAAAAWADAPSETAAALKHAYAAAQAGKIADVHTNLHRAVNCLVGPADSLFDATAPCESPGKGALTETTDARKKKHLQDAVDMAEMGIASSDFSKAIMLATGTVGAIRAIDAKADARRP